jgi:hypothetical protein
MAPSKKNNKIREADRMKDLTIFLVVLEIRKTAHIALAVGGCGLVRPSSKTRVSSS